MQHFLSMEDIQALTLRCDTVELSSLSTRNFSVSHCKVTDSDTVDATLQDGFLPFQKPCRKAWTKSSGSGSSFLPAV